MLLDQLTSRSLEYGPTTLEYACSCTTSTTLLHCFLDSVFDLLSIHFRSVPSFCISSNDSLNLVMARTNAGPSRLLEARAFRNESPMDSVGPEGPGEAFGGGVDMARVGGRGVLGAATGVGTDEVMSRSREFDRDPKIPW